MTLHQLRIFLAVAQASTLTRASKQLGLAQPSLSKQLAGLEESVGARLFEKIIAVASGEKTKSELAGIGDEEFAPWLLGAQF